MAFFPAVILTIIITHTHAPPKKAATSGVGGLSLDNTAKPAQEQKEKIARMRELTNADESTARFWLESFSWDLQRVRDLGWIRRPRPE